MVDGLIHVLFHQVTLSEVELDLIVLDLSCDLLVEFDRVVVLLKLEKTVSHLGFSVHVLNVALQGPLEILNRVLDLVILQENFSDRFPSIRKSGLDLEII